MNNPIYLGIFFFLYSSNFSHDFEFVAQRPCNNVPTLPVEDLAIIFSKSFVNFEFWPRHLNRRYYRRENHKSRKTCALECYIFLNTGNFLRGHCKRTKSLPPYKRM